MNPPALDLRDIHAPPPPEFWPPAPGWWVAALLLLLLATFVTVRLYQHYRLVRRRKLILAELEQLESKLENKPANDLFAELSTLLRRVALMQYSRKRVASLTGRDWLQFLDETGGAGKFSQGAGRVLEYGPYVADIDATEIRNVLALARDWLQRNTGTIHEH